RPTTQGEAGSATRADAPRLLTPRPSIEGGRLHAEGGEDRADVRPVLRGVVQRLRQHHLRVDLLAVRAFECPRALEGCPSAVDQSVRGVPRDLGQLVYVEGRVKAH